MKVQRDGNGGYDFNVQTKHIRRFWWIPLVMGIGGSGGGGIVAQRVLDYVDTGQDNKALIESVDQSAQMRDDVILTEISNLKTEVRDRQAENLTELRGIRSDILRLHGEKQ